MPPPDRSVDPEPARDEFLAELSHDLRSPLGSILLWVGILQQASADPEKTRRALEIIERSARTMEEIIATRLGPAGDSRD